MEIVKFYVSSSITDATKHREYFEEKMLDCTILEYYSAFDEDTRIWVIFCKYYVED